MKKLAIIGASYLQEPLIRKAKEMNLETHVFAWKVGDVGEKLADYFYPISIVEKEQILEKCKELKIDGICSIASDLASITVNYVAYQMGLTCNSPECVLNSTNKHKMRECFERNGDPSPKSVLVHSIEEFDDNAFEYPIIVKPVDRSGSRGITKLTDSKELKNAIAFAQKEGFEKDVLVEEFATGQEYSVECISWNGIHHFLTITKKYTTGAPHFVEMGHLEPAQLSEELNRKVQTVVFHALDSLGVRNGASHTEIKISATGKIVIIEIGARMGGDLIGSDLVELSTGIDFVEAVIQVALGNAPNLERKRPGKAAAVRFVFSEQDKKYLEHIQEEQPRLVVRKEVKPITNQSVTDSSSRFGYYLMASECLADLIQYMPEEQVDYERE